MFLSGLDTVTEEHILLTVFGPSGILKARGEVVILCTNTIRHLPSADYIIALGSDSTIVEKGHFRELVPNHHYFRGLGLQAATNGIQALLTTKHSILSLRSTNRAEPWFCHVWYALWVSLQLPTIWVSYWSTGAFSHSKSFYIEIYALLQCLAMGTVLSEAAIGMLSIIRSSGSHLYGAALRTVISTPLSFLPQADTAIITNLFSQDMSLIDRELAQALINTPLQLWIAVEGAGSRSSMFLHHTGNV
ncbi:hypothetical protein ETB97_009696 [Aspergillus alliaceus]|uniref:Uncharacterized protein n=1 Tax=Petromyces alliaceus TaxID=209559 RepID=A0A8H6A8B9_PETAA|nr:hypothetical protein ETB97_009696 [Aspergillus burnettii]